MSSIILGRMSFRRFFAGTLVLASALLAACSSGPTIPPPSETPLSKQAMMLLGRKGMEPTAPIYIRIFKEESELEVWKARTSIRPPSSCTYCWHS